MTHSFAHSLKYVSNSQEIIYLNEEPLNENLSECRDPLQNLGDGGNDHKFYRVECTVFAEPLAISSDHLCLNSRNKTDAKVFEKRGDVTINNDNVIVIKRSGKRKRYFINSDLSDLTCPQKYCNKIFASTTLLRAHIRKVHCADKDYVCEQCGASFSAQYLLKRHYLVHSDDKVQCPVCKKMLSKRTNMRLHLRSHADTRPHQCDTCHKRFLRRSTLKVHVSYVHKDIGLDKRIQMNEPSDLNSSCSKEENAIN